jgi:hypothetical protein
MYDHAHRGGLAGAIGSEEAGDPAGLDGEADAVHSRPWSITLGEFVYFDHGWKSVQWFSIPCVRRRLTPSPNVLSGAEGRGVYRRAQLHTHEGRHSLPRKDIMSTLIADPRHRVTERADPSLMTGTDPYEVGFCVSEYCNNGRSEIAS